MVPADIVAALRKVKDRKTRDKLLTGVVVGDRSVQRSFHPEIGNLAGPNVGLRLFVRTEQRVLVPHEIWTQTLHVATKETAAYGDVLELKDLSRCLVVGYAQMFGRGRKLLVIDATPDSATSTARYVDSPSWVGVGSPDRERF